MVRSYLAIGCLITILAGCAAFPDVVHQPQYHNPFPQLYRVAVLPFYNQSSDPHLNGIQVAEAYYQELQQIPGFEVVPIGVTVKMLESLQFEPKSGEDFQRLARDIGVDAVIVGSVTDFTAYYPPRMGISVNWYAANPGFHPIPVGYGLPWGTCEEEYIPNALVRAAEFELAREQLATQTPEISQESSPSNTEPAQSKSDADNEETRIAKSIRRRPPVNVLRASHNATLNDDQPPETIVRPQPGGLTPVPEKQLAPPPKFPDHWPDPRGFVPRPPSIERPKAVAQTRPIITHTKLYEGHNSDVTEALANYVYFRDDARFGGWQAYLQRSDDFIRFCCYLHITETIAARGGADETRVVWRWPIGRYER